MRRERDRRLRALVSLSLEEVRSVRGIEMCLKGGLLRRLV